MIRFVKPAKMLKNKDKFNLSIRKPFMESTLREMLDEKETIFYRIMEISEIIYIYEIEEKYFKNGKIEFQVNYAPRLAKMRQNANGYLLMLILNINSVSGIIMFSNRQFISSLLFWSRNAPLPISYFSEMEFLFWDVKDD